MIRMNQARTSGPPDNGPMETEPTAPPDSLTRPEALERIREKLKTLTDDENCMCIAGARLGVLCPGFRRFSDEDLRQRFDWIARKRPVASREEIERLVSLYHVARQQVSGAQLCCDVETREHCACDGWNGFDNAALEKLSLELTGKRIRIGAKPPA